MTHASTKIGFVQALLSCALVAACGGGGNGTASSFDAGSDAAADGGGNADAASDAQSGNVMDAAADRDAGPTAPVAFINPAPGSKLFLGANFWNIDWEGPENYFASSVDWATTQNPWNPQFLADLTPYHVLRFMDWNLVNEEENPQADWSTRKRPDTDQSTSPVAFEWQIDLCNRTQKDYWINIPHTASTEYMTKLATLIHDKLDPRLRVYVEWSNELWNGGFPQREYSKSQGEALKLAGDDKGFAYQMYASVRTFEAFDAAFGKDKSRLVRVISGQAANWGVCEHHLDALKDSQINPNGVKADVYAVAPYFTGANLDELNNIGIPEAASWITDTYRCAKLADLKVIAYEGGQDSYVPTGGAKPCANVQQLAGMRDTYVSFLDAMQKAELTGPFMQYTHSGYCWGMKQSTSDSTEASPKYQGMLDWISAQK
ncbi:MAG TPA: hypothetical protein VFN67_33205 [Polyangiales bacterium]|nr:hypothetical protein [Polyangiales bacterium]